VCVCVSPDDTFELNGIWYAGSPDTI